jgi:hypothetical protein
VIEALLFVLLVTALVVFVTRPLRGDAAGSREDPRIAELEARKEARYREIRDGELDHAAGKLSDEEFGRQDAELRREAAEILRELDRLRGRSL